ncbi:hypothetical protein BD779DRAFT_1532441 [Infundibulicybe gibba]|nr:hypothetical protein BD779DRAFT_1532441 [Infundibulicybe gibba]
MRKDVTADAARLSLSDRAAIATTQISSCALCIAFGSHEIIYSFPFPVDGSKSITRVARSSFYIEVEVPISSPRLPGGFMFQRFPIIKEGTTPTIWNIPYVKLDSMPRLGLENPWKLKWLESIILSLRATDVTVSATGTWSGGQDVFSKVKRTMSTLLYYAAGIQAQGPKKWFSLGLIEPTNVVKLSAILFIDGLRLDSASQTVVIDACVLCLTPAVIDRLHLILRSSKCTTNISADPPKLARGPIYFPTWKHTAKCEYISGTIPLSTDLGNDPLCSCGRGIGVLFPDEWKEWNELAPLFTRIAISPTFPLHPFDILGCARPLILEKTAQHLTPSACCTACNGPGKPELLACSACKQIKYCSAACQKNHWKVHKVQCKMVKRANVL